MPPEPEPPVLTDAAAEPVWSLYIVRCRGGLLYTGVTTDVPRRMAEHAAGGARSARFLRGREPLELVFQQEIGERGAALRAERAVKRLSRADKLALLAAGVLPEPAPAAARD